MSTVSSVPHSVLAAGAILRGAALGAPDTLHVYEVATGCL